MSCDDVLPASVTETTLAAAPSPVASTDPALADDRKRGGAPRGNSNARRHGLYSPRSAEDAYADRAAGKYRRELERAVLAAYGEIDVVRASFVSTATEATRVALCEFTELRKAFDNLDVPQRTAKRQAALRALEIRDRAVSRLGLANVSDKDDLRTLYARIAEDAAAAGATGNQAKESEGDDEASA